MWPSHTFEPVAVLQATAWELQMVAERTHQSYQRTQGAEAVPQILQQGLKMYGASPQVPQKRQKIAEHRTLQQRQMAEWALWTIQREQETVEQAPQIIQQRQMAKWAPQTL